MSAEEINARYEAEKQRLEDEFLKGMQQNKDSKLLRQKFDDGIKAAIERYNAESKKLLNSEKSSKLAKDVSEPINKVMDNLSETFQEER